MNYLQRSAFLRELATSGNIAFACTAGSCTRTEAFDERKTQAQFERDWREAEKRARQAFEKRARELGY